jgi:hypothetical protein|uniref:RING-CH-type domain-containing protein n=1 Tax=viral metagenome TaxID=1070528 RepID=A0A6C0AKX8_9ZZZZ
MDEAYYDDDLQECRICFDIETYKDKFISPCRCSGTSKNVHKKCIQKWRNVNKGMPAYDRCMECREPYIVKRKHRIEKIRFLKGKKYKKTNTIYFCIGVPISIMAALLDTPNYYLIDFLNGSPIEPMNEICEVNYSTAAKSCKNTTTLKGMFRSREGLYTKHFFYAYFVFNIQTIIAIFYIFYRLYKKIIRKKDYLFQSGILNFMSLMFLFKFIAIYKLMIDMCYSPEGMMGFCVTGSFLEPFITRLYIYFNKEIILNINADNPQDILPWKEELSINIENEDDETSGYNFNPLPSLINVQIVENNDNNIVEMNQIILTDTDNSYETDGSSEYETITEEDETDEDEPDQVESPESIIDDEILI